MKAAGVTLLGFLAVGGLALLALAAVGEHAIRESRRERDKLAKVRMSSIYKARQIFS